MEGTRAKRYLEGGTYTLEVVLDSRENFVDGTLNEDATNEAVALALLVHGLESLHNKPVREWRGYNTWISKLSLLFTQYRNIRTVGNVLVFVALSIKLVNLLSNGRDLGAHFGEFNAGGIRRHSHCDV